MKFAGYQPVYAPAVFQSTICMESGNDTYISTDKPSFLLKNKFGSKTNLQKVKSLPKKLVGYLIRLAGSCAGSKTRETKRQTKA